MMITKKIKTLLSNSSSRYMMLHHHFITLCAKCKSCTAKTTMRNLKILKSYTRELTLQLTASCSTCTTPTITTSTTLTLRVDSKCRRWHIMKNQLKEDPLMTTQTIYSTKLTLETMLSFTNIKSQTSKRVVQVQALWKNTKSLDFKLSKHKSTMTSTKTQMLTCHPNWILLRELCKM